VEQGRTFHNPLSASHIFSFALIFGILVVRPKRMIFSDIQFLPRLPLSKIGKIYTVIFVPVVLHRMRSAFYQKLTSDLDRKTAPPELKKLASIPKPVRMWLKNRALQAENDFIARELGEKGTLGGQLSARIVNKMFGPMLRERLGDPEVIVIGGAKANERDMAFFEVLGIRCLQGWGMTETTGALCVANRPDHEGAFGKCGSFFPGTKAYTVDGELVIEGPQVARGYYDPEGGFTPFNGKVFTGDYAEIDEQNRLKILGKVSDRITTVNGLNYNPIPFEEEIQAMDLDRQSVLDEVIIIGDGKPRLGAVFFLRPDAELDARTEVYLKQLLKDFNNTRHMDERIEPWMVVDEPFQQAGLLGPSGKLLRRVAEQKYAGIFEE
jgi:long-subunit acyl-CoA synthetase (AMP-forming)